MGVGDLTKRRGKKPFRCTKRGSEAPPVSRPRKHLSADDMTCPKCNRKGAMTATMKVCEECAAVMVDAYWFDKMKELRRANP